MNKIFYFIGILCFLVPFGLQKVDEHMKDNLIGTYEKTIEELDANAKQDSLALAYEYNETLFYLQTTATEWNESDYRSQLNLSNTGMMGYIEIPKIHVNLPIYHGTSKEVLASGIGHLEGTSLPVGGKNTHCILTGHCGLPSAELFTRLDELETGDQFSLRVYENVLDYEVVEIQVVEPEKVDTIQIHPEKDWVTLITCTPYGINTHRLLVKGERIEKEEVMEDDGGADDKTIVWVLTGSCLVLIFAGIWWKSSAGDPSDRRCGRGIWNCKNSRR